MTNIKNWCQFIIKFNALSSMYCYQNRTNILCVMSTNGLTTIGLQQFPALLYACDKSKEIVQQL